MQRNIFFMLSLVILMLFNVLSCALRVFVIFGDLLDLF